MFFPQGLAGRLYWLAVLPFHGFIFRGMANRIAAAADSIADEPAAGSWPTSLRPPDPGVDGTSRPRSIRTVRSTRPAGTVTCEISTTA